MINYFPRVGRPEAFINLTSRSLESLPVVKSQGLALVDCNI